MKLLTPEQRRIAKGIRKSTYILPLITIFVLGYYLYIGLSEMRLTGQISSQQLELIPTISIIQPIQSQFDSLVLKYRQILIPLVREQFKIESEMAHYRSTLRKTLKKIHPIEDLLNEIQTQLINHNTENFPLINALKEIDQEELNLTQEYNLRMEEYAKIIKRRAKLLNLNILLDEKTPLTSDKITSAYRLALYSAPSSELDINQEREWLQQITQTWETYEIKWNNQKNTLQQKRENLRQRYDLQTIKKQETDAIKNLEQLQVTLQQADEALTPLRQKLYSLSTQIQSKYEKFNIEIQKLPIKNKITALPLAPDGTFAWSNLTNTNLILPGTYVLWAEAKKNNITYWTLQHVYLHPNANTHLTIHETAFQPIHDIIPILHQP